jgi:hypothetical protein
MESKTLDEWFPNGRGDGRKFVFLEDCRPDCWYEPIIKSRRPFCDEKWYVLDHKGFMDSFSAEALTLVFSEWHPPKAKKKIKLYRTLHRDPLGDYYLSSWQSRVHASDKIIDEREIEVDE